MDRQKRLTREENPDESRPDIKKRQLNVSGPSTSTGASTSYGIFQGRNKILISDLTEEEVESLAKDPMYDILDSETEISDDSDENYSPSEEEESGDEEEAGISPIEETAAAGAPEEAGDSPASSAAAPSPEVLSFHDTPTDPPYFSFSSSRGLKTPPTQQRPIDFFLLLLQDEILDFIIGQTNEYAESLRRTNISPKARIRNLKPLTKNKLLVFLGLTFHTGTIRLNRLEAYWSSTTFRQGLLHIPCYLEIMPRDRYLLILQALHFAHNPAPGETPSTDRLYKLRPLLTYFNKVMEEVYSPGQELCIDESLVLWRGRLGFRQYIPNKRHKYGLKLYSLTEPNGVTLKFFLYAGMSDQDLGGPGHAEKVVKKLMEGKTGLGHHLYMDNFYNSVTLTQHLLYQQTYLTGTLRGGRKHNPIAVTKKHLKKGEMIQQFSPKGIYVMKRRDKRDVLMISSMFTGNLINLTNKRGLKLQKPSMVVNYNSYMGGVDHFDQYLAYHPCLRKSLKWYKKLAFHIFQMIFLNSFLLHRQFTDRRSSYWDYRLDVIEALVSLDYPNRPTPSITYVRTCANTHQGHWPTRTELSTSTSRSTRRLSIACRNCHGKGEKTKTSYFCKGCTTSVEKKIGLCPECFEEYHNKN